jgi:uncharacterized membrane protein
MSRVTLVSSLYIGFGLVLALTALPMWFRLVPPNAWYGFRTAKTLSCRQIWYEINQTAGRDLFFAGIAISTGAVLLSIVKDRLSINFVMLNLMLLVVALGAATTHSFYRLAQISKPQLRGSR